MDKQSFPIVYSCSGCSQVAQLANRVAVYLDRNQLAEMSCIAGIGGRVKPLRRLARSGRPILVIDGCPLRCAQRSLNTIDVTEDHYILLSEEGLKKHCDEEYGDELYPIVEKVKQDFLDKLIPLKSI
ncbi:putative zinc-binding protein [Marinospirillum insulare]|uniref:DGC domain-containing protein n=1 Tax=Marinospirillum insulare TaxID=217169 RepID=A0ABQ5ZYV3_9GAMM|nr:putative zinc-binding protein [Marinospirillum insulare]GLR64258.1 hypothetical protein GCM10007878_16960 [Marinospirillum insulare]